MWKWSTTVSGVLSNLNNDAKETLSCEQLEVNCAAIKLARYERITSTGNISISPSVNLHSCHWQI